MTQEIFRVHVKANFRTRTEAVSFINTAKKYLATQVQAGKAFDCDVECEASERYRKDLKLPEALP